MVSASETIIARRIMRGVHVLHIARLVAVIASAGPDDVRRRHTEIIQNSMINYRGEQMGSSMIRYRRGQNESVPNCQRIKTDLSLGAGGPEKDQSHHPKVPGAGLAGGLLRRAELVDRRFRRSK